MFYSYYSNELSYSYVFYVLVVMEMFIDRFYRNATKFCILIDPTDMKKIKEHYEQFYDKTDNLDATNSLKNITYHS